MTTDDLLVFLEDAENHLWHEICHNTESFLQTLTCKQKTPCAPGPPAGSASMPSQGEDRLRSVVPAVMDQSVREPATNTPFGHTGPLKYLTLKIVQEMGFRDIAVTGLYYKTAYTPETQILELMKACGDSMDGLIAMFGPGDSDRTAGLGALEDQYSMLCGRCGCLQLLKVCSQPYFGSHVRTVVTCPPSLPGVHSSK